MTHVSVFLPGLHPHAGMDEAQARALRLPMLELALSRSDFITAATTAFDTEAALCALFGLTPGADADLPIAALTARSDLGVSSDTVWLRADPVNLRPDMAKLLLFAGRHLVLEPGEAEEICLYLNQHLDDPGYRLQVGSAKRWYLQASIPARLKTVPPHAVQGQHIQGYLPKGADASAWNRCANELQMLLHSYPGNAKREDRRQATVNSVWFWGVGRLPVIHASTWSDIFAGDALTRGLGLTAGCRVHQLPADANAVIDAAQISSSQVLLVPFPDFEQSRESSQEEWQHGLSALESLWLTPLLHALRKRQLQQLTLIGPHGQWKLAPRNLFRFWRLRQSFLNSITRLQHPSD